MERSQTTVRFDKDIFDKLKAIAQIEKRPLNSQIELFVIKGIEYYEKKRTD